MKDTILRVLFLLLLAAMVIWQALITFGIIKAPGRKPPLPRETISETNDNKIPEPKNRSSGTPQHSSIPTDIIRRDTIAQTINTTTEKKKTPIQKEEPTYTVDASKCITCQLCIPVCPVDAISIKDGKAHIDQDICINCGICYDSTGEDYDGCPVDAITKK